MSGRLCRGRGSRDQAVRTRARALLVVGGALGLGGVFAVVAQGATPPAYAATASIAPALYYIGDSTGSNYVFTVKNTGTTTKIGAVEITRPSTYWTVNGCVAPYGWAAQLADTKCRFRASNSSFFIAANGASKNFTVKAKTAAGNVDRVGTWPVIVSASSQFDNTSLLKYASPAGGGLTTKLHTFELITAVVSDTAKTPGTACPAANKDAVVGSQKTIVVCGRNRANVALLPSSAYSSLSGTFVKTAGTFSSGVIQPNSANVVLAQWVNTTVSDVFGSGKKVVTKVGARSDRTSPLRTFTGYNATSSPPVAVDDSGYSVNEDAQLSVPADGVLGNDTDAENDPLTAVDATDPAHGTVALNADGSFTYTPDPDYAGPDSFQYKAYDTHSKSGSATVSITVNPVNDAPVAQPVSASTNEDTAKAVTLSASDVDGDSLSYAIVTGPGHGWLGVISGDSVTYTPDPNYFGGDSFQYKATDGTADSAPVTVTLTVTSVNDVPVADDEAYATDEDTQLAVTAPGVLDGDTDVESSPLTAVLVSGPSHGSLTLNANGSFTYTPAANYFGADSFKYKANDGTADSAVATVAITVGSVNDAPVAQPVSASTNEDTAKAVTFSASDVDGDSLSYAIVTGPGHGWLGAISGNSVTYTPDPNYFGGDSFQYKATDGTADSAPVTVTLTVTSVNDVPVADDEAYATDEDTQLAVTAPGVLDGDTDVESSPLTAVLVSGPSHGSLTLNANGSFTYTPAANYFGADSFKYKANDGTADSAVATVAITVGSVNDAPVAQPVSASTNEDTAKAVTFSASDVDGDSLSYAIVTGPGHGWLGAISGNSVTYTPDPNYFGGDSFQYKATDGTADSAPVTVTLTVTSVNDAPVAGDDAYQVIQGNALVVSAPGVLANDTDVDAGATKTALNASTPAHGGVTLNEDGSFTYTPVTTYTGPDSFTYDVSDGTATDTATVSLTVVPPNATPTADATSASGNEDAGAITVTLTGHDSDDDNLTFAVSSPVGGTLGTPAAPADCTTTALTCTTTVTFTPAADFNGAGSFSYTVYDGTISSAPAGATVTVNPVNDAPSFTAGAGQTVNEDAAAQTVTGWATGVSAGPANESAQTVSFTVTNDDNSLFATQPAVSPTGTLTYLPASDANGVATVSVKITDDGGNANGGVAESAVQTFTITVTAVNDAPSFLKGDDQTVLEDSGTYSVSNWASAISKGPADESGQALTFDVDVDTPALFLAQPTLSDTGTLQYTLAADAVGTATVTVTLSDNGGVLNGGDDTSDAQTFTITITPVNDAPSFTTAGSQSVLEDAAAQTVNGFVTSTSAGPADEAGQTVTVAVTNVTNPTMFAVQPTITNGTLTYTPAANANGVSTVTVSATDDGGIANGGDATSDNQTFAITVTAVNDAPSFVKGLDETVLEDAGTQSVSNWATSISAGPANENTQTVAFTVTNNNNGLFLTQPTISPTGTLVYAAAANKYGTATVTVVLKDSGGTANSGVDTAPTQTFVITVNPVNDPPSAIDQSFSVQTNMKISLSGLFTGATDTADTDQQPGYTPQYSVGTITATGANCPGCVVSGVNNALGTFDFEPPPGQTGTFTLKYTIVDSGYPTPGVESAQKTLTFTVSGDVIWFADATSGDDVTGNGTLARPFKTLTAVAGVDATNHKVFVHPGTYSTAFTLNAGEWLTGAGTKAASFDALMGITPPAGTIARPSINGTNPTVSGAVTLGSGNTLRGVDLTGATALSGSNFGTLTLGSGLSTDVRLNSTGQALNLNTGTISGDLLSTTSTGSAADNVNLTTVSTTGTSLGTGALSGATGDALEINGGTGSFSYAGTVTNTSAGRAVAILNKTGTSTVALSGAVNDNSGAGVAMTGNSSGTTVSLTGGVVLSSGTQPAFVATGAGTVSVTGATNTITSTTGTPLNITNVSIGAADVTFQSISANGAASGIVLDNTGSAGNFALTGTGTTAGSGGTIQNGTGGDLTSNQCAAVSSTAGTGIFLRNTRDASLKNMNLSNFSNFAVLGYDVTNLTMDRFSVTGTNGSNSSQDEDSVHFCNLLGSATISNSTINGGFENSLRVYNTSGTLNRLTVSATTLATRSATTDADDAFLATAFNTATMNVTLSNVTATTARGDLVQYALGDNSTGDLVIQNSTFTNNHPAMLGGGGGVTLGAGSASTSVSTNFTYSVTNNSFRDAVGNGLTLFLGNGTASGTIASNTFGVSGVQKSAGAASGIAVTKIKGGTGKVSILNNTIRSYGADAGIRVLANDGNPTLRATITGNSVTEPSTAAGSPSFAGITVEPGATGTDNVTMCLDLGGAGALQNSVSNGDPSNFNDINLPLNGNTTVDLPGYAGGTTDTTAVGNYLKARNSGDGTPTVFVSNSFVGTSSFTHVASNCL